MPAADLFEPGPTSLPLRAANCFARVTGGASGRGHRFVACDHYAATTEERPDQGRAPLEDPLGDVASILHEVLMVGDLHGVRYGFAGRLGVRGGTVAGDDLNPRVGPEPRCDGRRLPVREQVDDLPPLEVDKDRAVP